MKPLIKYEGVKIDNNIGIIMFSNEKKQKIEVPISITDAQRIVLYLDKLTTIERKLIERLNDEPHE